MSTHTYERKTSNGYFASPTQGNPTLNVLVMAALPGKTFVVRCSGSSLEIVFDDDLTSGEVSSLDSAYDSWTPSPQQMYAPNVRVETVDKGRVTVTEWYEDSELTKLAQRVTRNFQGNRLMSEVTETFYVDGAVATTQTTTYTTLSDGRVKTEVN